MKQVFLLYTMLWLIGLTSTYAQTTKKYEYDKLNRLAKVITSTSITTYSYDALGNRMAKRKIIDVTSVPEMPKSGGFRIYPNPAKEQVTIECPDSSIGHHICMTDMNGRELLKEEITSIVQSLRLDGIAPGLYIISISKNNELIVYIHKLLKR